MCYGPVQPGSMSSFGQVPLVFGTKDPLLGLLVRDQVLPDGQEPLAAMAISGLVYGIGSSAFNIRIGMVVHHPYRGQTLVDSRRSSSQRLVYRSPYTWVVLVDTGLAWRHPGATGFLYLCRGIRPLGSGIELRRLAGHVLLDLEFTQRGVGGLWGLTARLGCFRYRLESRLLTRTSLDRTILVRLSGVVLDGDPPDPSTYSWRTHEDPAVFIPVRANKLDDTGHWPPSNVRGSSGCDTPGTSRG
jgi:hypothetical protein